MLYFLIKKFINEPDNIKNPRTRERYSILACLIGIASNILLFILKIITGIVLNSGSVLADSFNNLSDSVSSVITLFGVKWSNAPPDEEHPFGHGRVEYICAFILSVVMILIGYEFLTSSLSKIIHPEEMLFSAVSLCILFSTVLVKLWQSKVNGMIGKKINSSVLTATAADSRNDVIVTSFTIVSIIINHFFSLNIDGYIGVLVAGFLIYTGIDIARDMFSVLLGNATDPEMARLIKEKLLKYDGIVSVHDLVVHNYGPHNSMASIHAEVPADTHINISHEIIDRAEKEISAELSIFLVIHMDPIDLKNEKLNKLKDAVKKRIEAEDARLNAHDFRMVNGVNSFNIIFDLIVPYEYSDKKTMEIEKIIIIRVRELYNNCNCIINIEKGYEGY